MAADCNATRVACVVDTIRDAIREPEFRDGLRAGLVALAIALVLGAVWKHVLRGRNPLPVAGLLTAAACTYALREGVGVPDRVVVALVLLAVAGMLFDALHLPPAILLVTGIPGAVLLASQSGPTHVRWVQILVGTTAVVGGAAAASLDRRWARHGLGPPLVALWALGAYVTLPDTEGALAILGATMAVALAAWPARVVALGGAGALPLVGLIAWNAAYGGFGRPSSIVGAVACAGVLVVEPATRMLLRSGLGPIDAIAKPKRARWWTFPVVAPVQLGLVFVAGRVAGVGHSLDRAIVIVVAGGVVALAIAIVVTTWTTKRGTAQVVNR
ncbi:MAG TPA: hypothetical protein VGQ20_07780 [Acidimicrobiales bacterium]|jgi:hypothetical protein|nr:hypothetical protein [Acidimicrobiales bacterium]